MSVVFARILKCYLSCDCYDIKEFTFPTAWHMGTNTRPSLADQGPAAAQLTTVAQLVAPGHHAPHAELTTPAMSTFLYNRVLP